MSTSSQVTPRYWLLIGAVFFIVIVVGTFNLDADGLWYDEWWSLYNAGAAIFGDQLTPAQILTRVATEDPMQMPGYPLLLSAWGSAVGWTELAGRALSLFAGLIAVAVTFRFALALTHDPLAALSAAALLAGSSWLLYFVHELRAFSLYVAFAAAFFYTYWRIVQRPQRHGLAYAAVALTGVGLLYMHPFGLTVYATVGIWHMLRLATRRGRRGWAGASLALAIPALVLLPWLNVLIGGTALIRQVERARIDGALLAGFLVDGAYVFSNTAIPLFGLLAAFSLRARGARLLWGLLVLLVALSLAAYSAARVNEIRYSIAVLPLLAMIGGLGVAALHRRSVPAPLLLTLWIIPALLLSRDTALGRVMQNTYPQPNREMAQVLTPYLSADAAVINYGGIGFRPEQQKTILVHYLNRVDIVMLEMESSLTLDTFAERLSAAVAGRDTLWLLYSPLFEGREYALVDYLLRERDFYPCRTLISDSRMEISAYGRLDRAAAPMRFGEAVEVRLISPPAQVGERLLVWLGFSGAAPADRYSVGVHLTDANGALVAQSDSGLPAPGEACRLFDLATDTLAPGSYHARLVIYDWRTGERLNGSSPQGAVGDSLPLASFELP